MADLLTDTQTIPLPTDLDEFEAELEAQEEGYTPQLLLPALPDAQRALARVRHFRKQAFAFSQVYDNEIERLEDEIQLLRNRKEEAVYPWTQREKWYTFALEQFARAQLAADPKQKTVKLPAGDLVMRAQQPEWNYGDEKQLANFLEFLYPAVVRRDPKIDKTELKKLVIVRDGKAYIPDDNGELIDIPITVTERPPSFSLKVEV